MQSMQSSASSTCSCMCGNPCSRVTLDSSCKGKGCAAAPALLVVVLQAALDSSRVGVMQFVSLPVDEED
jgi:hypothetical protein